MAELYTYEIADLSSDVTLDQLPLDVGTFEATLKGAGTCNATLALRQPSLRALDLPSLLAFGQRVLHIVRGGETVWSGLLWRGSRTRSTHQVQLQFTELESYLTRRLWTVDYTPTQTDQLDIARRLTAGAVGPLRLGVEQQRSGVLRDRLTEYRGADLHTVGELLSNLADCEQGFDYEIRTVGVGASRSRLLRFGYPRLGRPAGESGLVFQGSVLDWTDEWDAFSSVTEQWEQGASVGEGDLAAPMLAVAVNSAALNRGEPLLQQASQTHSTVTVQATLDTWARTDLAAAPLPVVTYTAVVRAGADPTLGSYSCGDEATFVLSRDDWYPDGPQRQPGLSIGLRILAMSVDVKADTVALTLGPPYDGSR